MPGRVALRPFVQDADFTLYCGDALEVLRALPDESVHCCVTSPPYLDARPEYPSPTLEAFVGIFDELARVVSGAALVNVGRLTRGGIERLWWLELIRAAELGGWQLLDTLVWIKPNANPLHGRFFADSHEYVFVLGDPDTAAINVDEIRTPYADEAKARMARRWVNGTGVKGAGRGQDSRELHPLGARPRSYVAITTGQEKGNQHPAPMPEELAAYLVKAGSWPGQTIIDPFVGSGTTALVARRLGRKSIGIELNPEYAAMCAKRLQQLSLLAG